MAKPAARRLLDVVKKKRRKQIVSKLLPVPLGKLGTLTRKRTSQEHQASVQDPLALTCLVQAKDVALFDKLGDGSFGVVRRGEWTTVIVSAIFQCTEEKLKIDSHQNISSNQVFTFTKVLLLTIFEFSDHWKDFTSSGKSSQKGDTKSTRSIRRFCQRSAKHACIRSRKFDTIIRHCTYSANDDGSGVGTSWILD